VLREIEADHIPQIIVFNKIDLTGESPRAERDEQPGHARVSLGLQRCRRRAPAGGAVRALPQGRVTQHMRLPPASGRLRALITSISM